MPTLCCLRSDLSLSVPRLGRKTGFSAALGTSAGVSAQQQWMSYAWRSIIAERNPPVTDRIVTIPNLLSVVRLLLVPVFLWLVLGPEQDELALLVLMVAGITDYLDGKLARRLNQTSTVGAILDPVADRLFILAVVYRPVAARHHPVVAGA